jgi:hypothetical protein
LVYSILAFEVQRWKVIGKKGVGARFIALFGRQIFKSESKSLTIIKKNYIIQLYFYSYFFLITLSLSEKKLPKLGRYALVELYILAPINIV